MTGCKVMLKIVYVIPFIVGFIFSKHTFSADKQDDYTYMRKQMVNRQIIARGIKDKRVISAMLTVPRHLFVPERNRLKSYHDTPLPIGEGQTISQPYIVAFMTECLNLKSDDTVLEIGTGSGYQAAVLAELAKEVYTVEILPGLSKRAWTVLKKLDYSNVYLKTDDGYRGWPEKAPFDAVIVTCAPEKIPQALIDQLKEGGRIIIPVGDQWSVQQLVRGVKKNGKLIQKEVLPVRFVPMVRDE